jgi:anti-sigma factor RsiW
MNPIDTHLTEDERQRFADDTLSPEERAGAEVHIAACESCAADVDRLSTLMKRIRETPAPSAPLDELWPTIRARIEQTKVVPLAGNGRREAEGGKREAGSGKRARWVASIGVIAAAAIIAITMFRPRGGAGGDSTVAGVDNTSPALIAVVDSAHAYEQEAQILLDKLELRRAMLRPETAQALARDLHVVDVAIAELKEAVARDPNNPALRRLLATSYRQKVDLLKRVSNAS